MPSGLAFVLCFCVVHSRPRTPPSGVAAIISIRPFFPGIQQVQTDYGNLIDFKKIIYRFESMLIDPEFTRTSYSC